VQIEQMKRLGLPLAADVRKEENWLDNMRFLCGDYGQSRSSSSNGRKGSSSRAKRDSTSIKHSEEIVFFAN